MDFGSYFQFLLALVFVLALIGLLTFLGKRYGLIPSPGRVKTGGGRRLGVVEVASVDAKRRLVLVRRDNIEHLILLGADSDTVIEQRISPATATSPATNSVKEPA